VTAMPPFPSPRPPKAALAGAALILLLAALAFGSIVSGALGCGEDGAHITFIGATDASPPRLGMTSADAGAPQ
jgi:hypothetical protein